MGDHDRLETAIIIAWSAQGMLRFAHEADRERLLALLRKAGLPE